MEEKAWTTTWHLANGCMHAWRNLAPNASKYDKMQRPLVEEHLQCQLISNV